MKASDYRKNKQKGELTGTIQLPSGASFVMRRPPLDVWIAAGKVPQSFLRAMLEVQQGANTPDSINLSAEETMAGLEFVTELIIYACVEPKVGLSPSSPDILDLAELEPEDFTFLTQWVQNGCPGVPVKTKAGEVELPKLQRFRQKQPGGGGIIGDSVDFSEVRDEAVDAYAAG
jgi:hypothetical protein